MTPTDKQTVEAIGAGRVAEAKDRLAKIADRWAEATYLYSRGYKDNFFKPDEEKRQVSRDIRAILAALSPASPAPTPMGEPQVLKGVGKINGDDWKDTTSIGEVVYVWNAEKPSPYAPGQYPRIGNEGWSASTAQYDFSPASVDEVRALAAPTPMGGEVEALREALRLTRERVRDWPLDDHETCMCGSPVEDHSIGSGHSPVSQADHAISMIVEGINEALAASSPSPAQGGEAALAISEHAFRAGHKAGWFDAKAGRIYSQEEEEESAWSEYEPPEEIKALS